MPRLLEMVSFLLYRADDPSHNLGFLPVLEVRSGTALDTGLKFAGQSLERGAPHQEACTPYPCPLLYPES